MSANFWASSHYQQWLLDRQDLIVMRRQDLLKLSEDEYQKLQIFFSYLIQSIGTSPSLKLPNQVIATAIIYFKRFYCLHSLSSIDPLLLAPTTLFLSSKIEEYGLLSTNRLISTCNNIVKDKFSYAWTNFPFLIHDIQAAEFYLLEAMDCSLVVFQPYRPLAMLAAELLSHPTQSGGHSSVHGGHHYHQPPQVAPEYTVVVQTACSVVNDCIRGDICLLHPPHIVALAALHIACVAERVDIQEAISRLQVDYDQLLAVTREVFALQEAMRSFNEQKEALELLTKVPPPHSVSGTSGGSGGSAGGGHQRSGQAGQQTASSGNHSSHKQGHGGLDQLHDGRRH